MLFLHLSCQKPKALSKSIKHVAVLLFFIVAFFYSIDDCKAQVTDIDVVRSLLGKSYYKTHPTLDSLGLWYSLHILKNITPSKYDDPRSKVYSISDGKGSVKVYFLKLDESKMIDEIVINFKHDSKEQVEDSKKITNASDYHVGYYSTDIVFKRKK
jgi:hypothetical protein